MAPAIVLLGCFLAVPIGYAVYLSLTNTRLTGIEAKEPKFVGLDNFTKLFRSDDFPKAVWLTLIFVIGSALIGQNLLGLALALLMQKRGWLIRTSAGITVLAAYVFPEIVPGFMWTSFLNENGALNVVLRFFHLPEQQVLVNQPMIGVILADIWRATAFSMLVYSAALGDIPEELIDAAEIDGASYTRVLRYVVAPQLRRTAFTNLMLITLPTMSVFTMIFVLTGGGPGNESETLPMLMYHQAFQFGELGYGTAISVVLLGLGGLLSLLYVIALRPGKGE
jgi:multiple sugar transport system permease protein